MDRVRIPAGVFWMGSAPDDEQEESFEQPQHQVYVDEFYIDRFPVTNEEYAKFCDATGYVTWAQKNGHADCFTEGSWKWVSGANWQHPLGPEDDVRSKGDHPVVQVNWHDAMAYCSWRSQQEGKFIRLPTEAEWERAARGEDRRKYPWGNQEPDEGGVLRARFWSGETRNASFEATTASVGSFPHGASPFGVLDMAGNVWEWCLDKFDPDYYRRSPAHNPMGPWFTPKGTFRGGSWVFPREALRVSRRGRNHSYRPSCGIGFRCVEVPRSAPQKWFFILQHHVALERFMTRLFPRIDAC